MTTDPWWQAATFYQIYPRSFGDGNGDGVGDLPGALERLPYLAELGIDAVWLSPFFPSPMRDFGYDVTDYTGIDPLFGTLADFDRFVEAAHALGIRVVIDFVPNHTSDEHSWFRASRERDDRFADWYVWRDAGGDGTPPNNWRSVTGGSAWSWDEGRGQYFLHSFLPFQPDLDLVHPPVLEALQAAMRHWLDRGVDGLRVDMIDFLAKDPLLRDEPDPDYRFADAVHHLNRTEEIRPILRALMGVMDEYDDRVLIGEINPELDIRRQVAWHGDADAPLMDLPFNFGLMRQPFEARALGAYLSEYDAAVPAHGWPNLTLGNHDVSRLASRLGAHAAPLAAVLLLSARGTPFLYYGDELGLEDVPVAEADVQDPWGLREPGRGRDPNRTPMPWDAQALHAGFSAATPWLPVGEGNRAKAPMTGGAPSPTPLAALYRRLLALRRRFVALRTGNFHLVELGEEVLGWRRVSRDGAQSLLVVMNLTAEPAIVTVADVDARPGIALVTDEAVGWEGGGLRLVPWSGAILDEGARRAHRT